MVQGMKEHGKMIFSMDKEKKHGQMAQFMKESIWEVKSMVSGSIVGMMDQDMKVNGMKIK